MRLTWSLAERSRRTVASPARLPFEIFRLALDNQVIPAASGRVEVL
jgi:hypothetical protein